MGRAASFTRRSSASDARQKDDGFTELRRGSAVLALNNQTLLNPNYPARLATKERIDKGVEIVLIAEDLDAVYDHILASKWPLSTSMTHQPWGTKDLRLVDPDGCYIRVTGP